MKKMPTLFVRTYEGHNVKETTRKVTPGCEWVLAGDGYATEKLDGTCCMIKDNVLYRRYDYKPGKILPEGAIPCQEERDPITGHFPHWVLCKEDDPNSKYHLKAFDKSKDYEDGTYELMGPHFNGNPYKLEEDVFEKHGLRILEGVPRTYDGLKEYLKNHFIEGIVFYRGNGEMCKIKRSDFGYSWNQKKKEK